MSRLTLPSTLPRLREKKIQNKKKIADCCVIQRRKVSTLGCYLVTSSKEKRKEKSRSPGSSWAGVDLVAVFHSLFFFSFLSDFCLLYSHTHTPLSYSSSQLFLACGQILFNHALCGRDCTHTKNDTRKNPTTTSKKKKKQLPPTRIFCVKIFFDFFWILVVGRRLSICQVEQHLKNVETKFHDLLLLQLFVQLRDNTQGAIFKKKINK